MPRYIRLREYAPNVEFKATPTDEYLATCNESLIKKDYLIRTDGNGFIRNGENNIHREGSIVYLGDSVVENYWIEEQSRSSAVAERYLDLHGLKLSVLNAGKTGATTIQLLNVFINKCIPLEVTGVIINSCVMDDLVLQDNGSLWLEIIDLDKQKDTEFQPAVTDLCARTKGLSILHAACCEINIPFWVTTWGFTRRAPFCAGLQLAGDAAEQWFDRIRLTNEATRQFTKKRACGLIDFERCLGGRDELFYDGLHPNALGCAVVGEAIGKAIIEHFRPAPKARTSLISIC